MPASYRLKRAMRFAAGLAVLALLLAGCGGEQPEETPEVEPGPAVISATGQIVPTQQAMLSFSSGGQLAALLIEEGQVVREGAVIARLDTAVLDAEVARAEAALNVAVANLERARTGPHPEEVAEARANLAAAGAETNVAAAQRDAVATSDVDESQIARTRAAIQEAAIEMEARRFEWEWVSSTWIRPEEYETYEWFELPLLVDDARRRYEDATRAFWATEARLEELQRGPHPGDIRAAEAEVSATGAEAGARQAELALAESAPRTEEIAVAEAAVERALASLARTRLNRQQAELIAPFGGTVSRVLVQPAQYVAPGEAVAQIADLSHLRVETTDLSEIDVAGIAVGDPATVTFDALPGVTVQGTVTHISPRAEEGTGVNFTVRIELDEIPPAVRWGMTAFVDIPLE